MAKRAPKKTLKDKLEGGNIVKNKNHDFVTGVHGDYLIGTDPKSLHHFNIETTEVPGNNFREAYELKKITGDVSAVMGGPGVHVPFAWLFKEVNTCKFAPGNTGAVQAEMLTFLKESLKEELLAVKEASVKNQASQLTQIEPCKTAEELDILAQTKANTLIEQVAVRQNDHIFKIATVDGKAVKPCLPCEESVQARPRENLLPLSILVPGKFGRYDFGANGLHCVVDYFQVDSRPSTFFIVFMHPEHPLAQAGVKERTGVYGKYVSKDNPIPFPKNFEGEDRKLYEARVLMRDFFLTKLAEVGKVSEVEKQSHDEQAAA